MQNLLSRRSFVKSASSLLLLPGLGLRAEGAVRRNFRFADNPFQLGVASGDPWTNGFVLWTRLAPKPLEGGGLPDELIEVRWELAADEAMSRIVRRGTTVATPQLAHSVHVELSGLVPDRWYWYRFKAGGEISPIGRTRTLPARATEPERLRFAFASCQHYEQGYYTAYEHMARQDLDLVFHLGDYIYEGAAQQNRVRQHVGPELVTLQQYRNRYALYRTDENLRAAHAAFPWIVTWDDHEFDDNYAADVSEEAGVDAAAFLKRRAAAYQAYYEHMPLLRRSLPQGPNMRLYRRVRFGRLADFFVLDTRQYRSDQPNGDGLKPLEGAVFDPRATMLGRRQRGWLQAGLIGSSSTWNVLPQQVLIARVDRIPGKEDLYPMDKWAGYEVERQGLMEFLHNRRVHNPVVLSGDIHTNYANELKLDFDDPDSPTVGCEFVGTSISSGGDGSAKLPYTDGMLAENPFIKFHNAERGYVRCTVTPDEWRSDYEVVPYVTRHGAPLVTRASFVIEDGKPGMQSV